MEIVYRKLDEVNNQLNSYNINQSMIDKKIENRKKYIDKIKNNPPTNNKLDFIRLLINKVIVS